VNIILPVILLFILRIIQQYYFAALSFIDQVLTIHFSTLNVIVKFSLPLLIFSLPLKFNQPFHFLISSFHFDDVIIGWPKINY